MPDLEFVKMLDLCFEWTNRDAEYIYECPLKDNAPEDVKKAFEKLKKMQKEFDAAGICV